jgi:hypothetical protein
MVLKVGFSQGMYTFVKYICVTDRLTSDDIHGQIFSQIVITAYSATFIEVSATVRWASNPKPLELFHTLYVSLHARSYGMDEKYFFANLPRTINTHRTNCTGIQCIVWFRTQDNCMDYYQTTSTYIDSYSLKFFRSPLGSMLIQPLTRSTLRKFSSI